MKFLTIANEETNRLFIQISLIINEKDEDDWADHNVPNFAEMLFLKFSGKAVGFS